MVPDMVNEATGDMQARWLPVVDASVVLGISGEMLRLRMSRQTIRTRVESNGEVLVRVPYDLTGYIRCGFAIPDAAKQQNDVLPGSAVEALNAPDPTIVEVTPTPAPDPALDPVPEPVIEVTPAPEFPEQVEERPVHLEPPPKPQPKPQIRPQVRPPAQAGPEVDTEEPPKLSLRATTSLTTADVHDPLHSLYEARIMDLKELHGAQLADLKSDIVELADCQNAEVERLIKSHQAEVQHLVQLHNANMTNLHAQAERSAQLEAESKATLNEIITTLTGRK